MGRAHLKNICDGKVTGLKVTAVCDLEQNLVNIPEGINAFSHYSELFDSDGIDAVHIAVPHPFHCEIGVAALNAGLHVMMEKPLAVHKAECEQLLAAHKDKSRIFAAMFNQRTDPYYRRVRDLVQNGELGDVRRVHWTVTDWFRTQEYYASGGWRATWKGEGGGVLLNQCPHNLDLYQWMFGMPSRVHGFCQFGRYHQIEVEDDVTAYLQYPDGRTGVFVTSTGEAPGVNRLEVIGERGHLKLEDNNLLFRRNRVGMSRFSDESASSFGKPDCWNVDIPVSGQAGQHNAILQNFADAILKDAELISPASDGIHSVELANAILYSAWKNKTIDLPLDSAAYATSLQEKIDTSTFKKREPRRTGLADADDFASSF